ncbi:MAG: double-strand break repair protein AddB [Parvularculaceae bacterium]
MTISPSAAFFADPGFDQLRAPRYFSIDQGRPFLPDLARGLIAAFGDDLPRAEIFLPTRRAARALVDALLDARAEAGVQAALLPKMRAIGDIDDDDPEAFAGDAADEIEIAPALPGPAREIMLARLVAALERQAFSGQENWPAALSAARELGKLLDSLYTEELDPARIAAIDVGDRAAHWGVSRDFLEIVTRIWPTHLANIGRADPGARRASLINAKARRIAANPPAHPIVIAGTTASAPSVAALFKAIAGAPRGAGVLPGLDRDIDARAFAAIGDAHPQGGLKLLLKAIGRTPDDIAPWPHFSVAAAPSGANRAGLLRLALRPADATDEWRALIDGATAADAQLAAARDGLTLIEAETEDAEASIIAMIFREAVEVPRETAMLVTPDRTLARRVALKMQRWDIAVEDSGGVPFANSPCGTFLRLVALAVSDPGDPVAMLAVLRHPLATLGLTNAARERGVDALDRAVRGVRPADDLAGIAARLRPRKDDRESNGNDDGMAVLRALEEATGIFGVARTATLSARITAHLAAAERLAGAGHLWAGDDGAVGAGLLAEILECEDDLNAIGGGAYADVFSALIAGAVVRRASGAHPRLSILGPLEARLQSADHVILAGLNEGVWPADAPADPFLSRAMREAVGLPSPERRIGLSAHDFAQGAAARRVTLTRAKRTGGKPAKPSRWIVRLRTILGGASLDGVGALQAVDQSAFWRRRAESLDAPDMVEPVAAPAPRAGKDRRPQKLSVTQIETWLRDPYAIYAREFLRLRKLDDPGNAIGPREMGTLFHRVFERAVREQAAPTLAGLRGIFDEEAPRAGLAGASLAFWDASIAGALGWFAAFDAERRKLGQPFVEEVGEIALAGIDPPFLLAAKADRLERLADGAAAIFDYKTGAPPSEKQDKTFSPQLALTGVIVEAGGFQAIGDSKVALYRYLRAVNRKDDKKDDFGRDGADATAAIRDAEAGLRRWIAHFDDPSAAYRSQPRAQFVKDEGDYDQLARRREWSASQDAAEDSE